MTTLANTTKVLLVAVLVVALGLGLAIGYALGHDGRADMPMRMMPGGMGSMDMGSMDMGSMDMDGMDMGEMRAHMQGMGMMDVPGSRPAPGMPPMHGHD